MKGVAVEGTKCCWEHTWMHNGQERLAAVKAKEKSLEAGSRVSDRHRSSLEGVTESPTA